MKLKERMENEYQEYQKRVAVLGSFLIDGIEINSISVKELLKELKGGKESYYVLLFFCGRKLEEIQAQYDNFRLSEEQDNEFQKLRERIESVTLVTKVLHAMGER